MRGGIVIGADVGTGGVRCVAVTPSGEVVASSGKSLPPSLPPQRGWVEQRPEDWREAMWGGLRELLDELNSAGASAADVTALCVDSTSGTILPVSADGTPLGSALMYNDARATAEADELNRVGTELTIRMGYRFNSSYGLAKILWILRNEPATYAAADFVNAADFLTGTLCGCGPHTDYTNALKMGYDLLNDRWPEWLQDLGLDSRKLPRVHRTGELVGRVSEKAARDTGLRRGTPVAIGPTDGVAALYASGAVKPGESATTLGTTLVIKSVSRGILLDPKGRIYSHRHAEGRWLPGGAGNCGCAYAAKSFPEADLDTLGREAENFLPCRVLLYPLPRKGERFPVVAPDAERFMTAQPSCEAEHFAAYLQGAAFIERWAYEIVAELGGETGGTVFTSGGGSRSDVWMQIRADVMNRQTARTVSPDSVFGSAVLAASRTMFHNVDEAVASLVREERRFSPAAARRRAYDDLYRQFHAECARRGVE